jgi:hypothetical protein
VLYTALPPSLAAKLMVPALLSEGLTVWAGRGRASEQADGLSDAQGDLEG